MKNRNQFYAMDKQEAFRFIWECVDSWCRVYGNETARIERCVETVVRNYNDNNIFGYEIDAYPYYPWDESFNNGCEIGMGIEDDYFIFPEFADDWEKFQTEYFERKE